MDIGKLGIWRRRQEGAAAVEEIEAFGYGTLWLGSSPAVEEARPALERTRTLVVATGILNVWRHEPDDVAAQHAALTREFPGRFLLGIGIGHPERTAEYRKPLTTMRAFFDGLDAAPEPVPREQRIAAALGPKMLALAAERSLGAHPYFAPPEHTRDAREAVGRDGVVATGVAVVVEPDAESARERGREYAATYLGMSNYVRNLQRFGFGERHLADGGSDRLIDVLVPHGSAGAVAEAVQAHFDAGADHVCLQPLGQSVDDYRALAAELL
jgi:probable F420-dependent oxidoreductase